MIFQCERVDIATGSSQVGVGLGGLAEGGRLRQRGWTSDPG